ncbi:MAG: hypothetical protein LBE38_01745 [Deltaproteobacteria bacterium]|jgi:hypothetical protein|nr:hypothetical protein [Deltaproteobacteria bacterium]
MALIPSTPADKKLLLDGGHQRFVFPVDEILEIDKLTFGMTIPVMLTITKEALRCGSYEETEQMLIEKTHIRVNDDTIRKVTDTIGEMVFKNDLKRADEDWERLMHAQIDFPNIKKPNVLYLEVDGAMLPTREKDEHGSIWRENKLGMAFSDDNFFYWVDKHGKRQHRIIKREFINYIGDCNEFKKFMFSLALRNGYGHYKETVLISDGATWIRNMKEELFPDAQQILDFYHLCENVSTCAKDVFLLDEGKYKPWAKKICDLFKASKYQAALANIDKLYNNRNKKAINRLKTYINNNINHIDYANYIKKGYFIGSGAVESANRYVPQGRLKLPGMRWQVKNGQYVLSLMAKYKSALWEQEVVEPIYDLYGVKRSAPNISKIYQYYQDKRQENNIKSIN